MLTEVPCRFTTKNGAQAVLTATRRKYRVALRGACITPTRCYGGCSTQTVYVVHYPMGGTGFSPEEMASAMRSVANEHGLGSYLLGA